MTGRCRHRRARRLPAITFGVALLLVVAGSALRAGTALGSAYPARDPAATCTVPAEQPPTGDPRLAEGVER